MDLKHFYSVSVLAALVLPASGQQPKDVAPHKPEVYFNPKVNYVRTWQAVTPTQDATSLHLATPLTQAQLTTQYLDGLGRPLQTVSKAVSPQGKDLVAPVVYDQYGREVRKYLPYVDVGGLNDGLFKATNPFSDQMSFYNTQLDGQGEQEVSTLRPWSYSKAVLEASPLNRVVETFAPGKSWVGSNAAASDADRKSVKFQYLINTEADAVRIWTVQEVTGSLGNYTTPATNGTYMPGQLQKTVTIDERGSRVVEYKDKEGKVILKKVQQADYPQEDHRGWLSTYYVYDDLGQLRCVIQPKAVALLDPLQTPGRNWALDATLLKEQCFRYAYDHHGRMITKQVPGAAAVEMVYDSRDRLVMTQDGNQRRESNKQWLVTRYDDLNRPTHTYLITDPTHYTNAAHHREQAANSTAYPNIGSFTNALFSETHYDHYNNLPTGLGLSSSPIASGYSPQLETPYYTAPYYAQEVKASSATKGLVTWTKTRVLGTSDFLYSVNLYDDKGRVVQVQTKNHTSGLDVATTQYDWSGKVLRTHLSQQLGASTALTIGTKMNYDGGGRVTSLEKSVNGSAWRTTSVMTYDELGQLQRKTVGAKKDIHGNYTATPLELQDYTYNIRGWLLGQNRDFAKDKGATGRYFGFDLGYDKASVNSGSVAIGNYTAQYNGNIGGMVWKSFTDKEVRKYDFSYDKVNRLTAANFSQYGSGTDWYQDKVNFSVPGISYDANGNIKSMKQWGLKLGGSEVIDELSYDYMDGEVSNRLQAVRESAAIGNKDHRLGDFTDRHQGSEDYFYDVNGNLTADINKGITSITYNHLNLPHVITMQKDDGSGVKGTITYVYSASGVKLKKIVEDYTTGTPKVTTTTYLGGLVYEKVDGGTDVLQYMAHEEGRIRYIPVSGTSQERYEWDFFLKDHLGNVRMVLTEEKRQDIYPAATLEGSLTTTGAPNAAFEEKKYYTIEAGKIVDKPGLMADYPNQNNGGMPHNPNPNSVVTASSQKVYRLNGGDSPTGAQSGLGITLKVMGGDKIDLFARSFFSDLTGDNQTQKLPATELINGLFGTPGSPAGAKGVTASAVSGLPAITSALTTFLDQGRPEAGGKPRAFLNWILLDEQFQFVAGSSNFDRVGEANDTKEHKVYGINIAKSGYLYVYVSNESPVPVYFDNLQVVHSREHVLEETHYYPFGLTMSGISSRAAGGIINMKGYNGNEFQNEEFSDGRGLGWYDYGARMYDAQIGRWHVLDSMAESKQEGLSPYQYVYNNPILYSDHEGNFGIAGALIGGFIGGAASLTKSVIQNGFESLGDSKTWAKAGVNFLGGAVVGATGGVAAFSATATTLTGMAATAVTSFGTSIVEDKIDGNEVDYSKAAVSSFIATATFGFSKYGTDKLTKFVRQDWWKRGNTNGFMKYLGKNPTTRVGQVVDRVLDVAGVGSGLSVDLFFPARPMVTLKNVAISGNEQRVRTGIVIVHPVE